MSDYFDGINCINIYSKGVTELGRLLSNFARIPIHGNGHTFASVEAWWYWYTTGKVHHHLKNLHGFKAKEEGRKLQKVQSVTPEIFRQIAVLKLDQNVWLKEMFKANTLPFVHFYEYGGKVVIPPHDITADAWNSIRISLIKGG